MRTLRMKIGLGLTLLLGIACSSSVMPMPTSTRLSTDVSSPTSTGLSTDVPGPTSTRLPSDVPSPTPLPSPTSVPTDPYAAQREVLVDRTIVDRGVTDPDVLAAMRTVPRHLFVPAEYVGQAYADHPLGIGYGQTISQPYIVALMTELLELEPDDRVLEIGTGSGYQAAVLAVIVDEVYTIEIVPELAASAAARLKTLGYENVVATQGDGYFGWDAYAPYDAIIVTAAPDHLPQPLVGQLKEGGYIVIPIGPQGGFQSLWRFTRTGDEIKAENLMGVRFVPFTGPGVEGRSP